MSELSALADAFKGVAPVLRKLAALPDIIDGLVAEQDRIDTLKRTEADLEARIASLTQTAAAAERGIAEARSQAADILAKADAEAAATIAAGAKDVSDQLAAAQTKLDAKMAELAAAEDARAEAAAETMRLEKRQQQLDEAYAELRARAQAL